MQSSKGQAWFCTTGLPSDIVIDVADMTFHLHKFPLMSRSRKLNEMITAQETAGERSEEDEEAEDEVQCQISFPEFPGGSETFETVAKFCYGVKIEMSSLNVAPLRCAAEFLEMTDEYSEGNLISKTEVFLSQLMLKSGKECVKVLKSCEKLMPLAEELNIVERCIDSFVSRVASADPGLFGWPVGEGGGDHEDMRKGTKDAGINELWLQDVARLGLSLFKRLILEMRVKEVFSEVIENCLLFYAKKRIPGISRSSRMSASSPAHSPSQSEQRELLETVVTNLPLKRRRSSRPSPEIKYIFGLLRTANILNATESCKSVLEKKIGFSLDQATLDDLLIPSFSYLNETLYDIDCVGRILQYFLDSLERRSSGAIEEDEEEENDMLPALTTVGKLIDGYLSEIASNGNLKPEKFIDLAISLPDQARVFDDGLYRAVDVYLKAHPWLSETEREKICGIMDCQKLTLDACTHAAQNERLPLRAIVQIHFFEQLQLRQAIASTLIAAERVPSGHLQPPSMDDYDEDHNDANVGGIITAQQVPTGARSTWKAAVRENQVLRLDMDSMRTRVHQLERECATMKKVIENIDKSDSSQKGWKGSLGKKFGCKFKTQVCDSHESNVVNTRRSRQNRP